jgi:transcription elongation factor GreB
MIKNYITAEGAEKLKSELKKLLNVDRPELVQVITWAASNGDRSENGDYIYGKRRLREIDRRIRFLTQRLESAEIVDPALQDHAKVLFGASVVVLDEQQQKRTLRVVGQDEIDTTQGWISWKAPLAKALLNSKVGDVVSVHTPKGVQEYEVVKISYEK